MYVHEMTRILRIVCVMCNVNQFHTFNSILAEWGNSGQNPKLVFLWRPDGCVCICYESLIVLSVLHR